MTESVKNIWNAKADDWARQNDDEDSYFTRRTHFISEFITSHVAKCRSLDVGCGGGLLVERLTKAGYDAYGCDLADEMVSQAQSRLDRIVDRACTRIRVSTPDSLPFDLDFGLVTAIGVFNYVPDYGVFLQNLSASLMPGGFICATCTNRFSIYSLMQALRSLLRGNLRSSLNLIRTGIWSGGHVDPAKAKQCYSAGSFDHLFANYDYELVGCFGMFNFRRFDRSALCRKRLGKLLVRYVGWNYIAMYQKLR
jgi:SAM-dependent methyltransferase